VNLSLWSKRDRSEVPEGPACELDHLSASLGIDSEEIRRRSDVILAIPGLNSGDVKVEVLIIPMLARQSILSASLALGGKFQGLEHERRSGLRF